MKWNAKSACWVASGVLMCATAQAGMVKDGNGNVGYDTAAECDAAVQAGQAVFYRPVTTARPLRRKGETSVRTVRLADLGPQYRLGACDMGVGRGEGRNGVSKQLQGKYVPFSPEMPVNLYANQAGQPVRASMAMCDNRFAGMMPRPVPIPAPAPVPVAAPVAAAPAPAPAPVVAPAPAPVAAAPVAPPASRMTPYLFGTLGSVADSVIYSAPNPSNSVGNSDRQVGTQFGAGLQFNPMFGAEVFYQAGKQLEYAAANSYVNGIATRALGARMTVGRHLTDDLRMFAKVGLARITHANSGGSSSHWDQVVPGPSYSQNQTRATVGLGATYALGENLSLRADLDHFPKRRNSNPGWGNLDYVGVGLQYKY